MSVFRIEPQPDGIAHLVMDHPERKLNVLDAAAVASLDVALDALGRVEGLKGVVLTSGKRGSFIAGADIEAIGSITDREQILALIRRAHAVFGKLAALPVPTVAAIDGVCLGGGTELSLCCDSRIASEEPRTQIGLPEVLLGIFPGFGGSVRLPRLIGLRAALDLILTGRTLDARRAEKLKLIARVVPAAWILERAHEQVVRLAARAPAARRDRWRAPSLLDGLLDGTPFGRAFVFSQARAQTRGRTAGNYPAPLAALDVIEHSYGRPLTEALEIEASRVADVLIGPVCKNLVRIFQLSEDAKKAPPIADTTFTPAPIRELALAGAGVMGGGIAELASRSGITVRVRDLKPEPLTRALEIARKLIEERGKRRRAPASERDLQMARIYPTLTLDGFGRADAAIEAVVEDLDVKRRVFAELEVRLRPDALLATNTSSLSVDALAAGLQHPGRFCGFHFFNPVHRMPLVEVVRGERTSDAALVTAVALARRLGKTPVVVKDAPGFVVNRVLMPYLREAMMLLEEGFPLEAIDAAMRNFGMPMGPFEVIDEVGLDVGAKVAGVLSRAFPERMTPAPLLDSLIAAGRLGRKNGLGFYRHRGRKRETDPAVRKLLGLTRHRAAPAAPQLAERMVLAMVNESARCLEEGVVVNAGQVDLALVFGAGFPPFRGGPLRHADAMGLAKVQQRLVSLQAEKGERFRPSALLSRLAESGGAFTSK
ncbi:MAG: fatty acid oxidation complex subunit alpha FadJ [Candidatus Eisenbacteria bacterium]|uniref:enoyl-CoA hydratase n=1 Tax=Eiseniibacteriota bacterium TaxID=2212470 RepID=A0A849SHU2_UNCEI|nr:fatty acid oxidation complex subunit alpha FadJ [Candidatus Eisenbacteria bacterium]